MSDDDNSRPHLRLLGQQGPTGPADAADAPAGGPSRTPVTTVPVEATSPLYPPGAWSTLHDLTGRVVLLTGHGDGIDDALASGLADHGARLAIAQRDIERAKRTAQVASRPGGSGSIAFAMDPARAEQVRRGVAAVEQLTSQLDGLVVIVDLGRGGGQRAEGGTDGTFGITLGEMIHLVRAAGRRMAVLGGGRIVIVASGAPRDPAVGAITAGAVTEFVRTAAPGLSDQGVSLNGVVATLPVAALLATAPPSPPQILPAIAGPPPEDTVVDSLPEPARPEEPDTSGPTDDGEPGDEVLDQTPVIPFPGIRAVPDSAPGPTPPPDPAAVRTEAPALQPYDYAAPAVAAAILFLAPGLESISGQVVRIAPLTGRPAPQG